MEFPSFSRWSQLGLFLSSLKEKKGMERTWEVAWREKDHRTRSIWDKLKSGLNARVGTFSASLVKS